MNLPADFVTKIAPEYMEPSKPSLYSESMQFSGGESDDESFEHSRAPMISKGINKKKTVKWDNSKSNSNKEIEMTSRAPSTNTSGSSQPSSFQ
mmetsp:Transcript_24494/g.37984  ORF Transcript_24494/g.37984 Transcript_24494/m.37984 type:complete len:93 (-) Transcript_24494:3339-3617(-)